MVAARQSVGRVLKQSHSNLYVCTTCRHQLRRTTLPFQQQRFASGNELPVTERVRRKLWGTDNPPGLKDPYGGPGFFERRRARRAAEPDAEANEALDQNTSAPQTSKSGQSAQSTEKSPIDELAENYVPAETWDELEVVGTRSDEWERLPLQAGDIFSAWLDPDSSVATNREQLVSCLHQALVECFTCSQAGLDPQNTYYLDSTTFDVNVIDAFASSKIAAASLGQASQVQFASDAQAQEVVEVLAAVDETLRSSQASTDDNETVSGTPSELSATDGGIHEIESEKDLPPPIRGVALHYVVQDESFLRTQLNIEDPVSFTVLKRFSQLSGHRIPDPVLNAAFSSNQPLSFIVERLLELVVQPKPTKIADLLMSKPDLLSQSNVMVFPRRETPIDKEKELGRWKVIEKELQDRGLPARGHRRDERALYTRS